MKKIVLLLLASSVLMACESDPGYQYTEPAFNNEVKMNFLSSTKATKTFGHSSYLSSVECQYSSANNSLKLVAYRFQGSGEVQMSESLQIMDHGVSNSQSGHLVPQKDTDVPAVIYMSSGYPQIEYTEKSNCSTFYEIEGKKIRGTILCSALESTTSEKEFVSVEFQCRDQDYLLFEVKKEML